MAGQLLLLAAGLAVGAMAQRRADPRLRDVVWDVFYWTLTPVLAFDTFLTVHFGRSLVLALAAAIAGSWLAVLLAYAYARAVARTRAERGALALGAGFGNTGFVGIPLAQLAFGHPGIALAVLYDRLAYLVPAITVTVAVARSHGLRPVPPTTRSRLHGTVRAVLLNPPLVATAAAIALRIDGVGVPGIGRAGSIAADLVGPVGFLLLGLAVPFERFEHEPEELRRAAGAVLVRLVGGPACLRVAALVLGAHVPGAFYVLAGMPTGFHLLVLSRLYDVRPQLMRLIVVASTAPAVLGVATAVLVLRAR